MMMIILNGCEEELSPEQIPVALEETNASKVDPIVEIQRNIETKYFDIDNMGNFPIPQEMLDQFDQIYVQITQLFNQRPGTLEDESKVPLQIKTREQMEARFGGPVSGYWGGNLMLLNDILFTIDDKEKIFRVLRHELIHGVTNESKERRASAVPMWAVEGVAHYHDYDPPYTGDNEFRDVMRDTVMNDAIIPWSSLTWGNNIVYYAEAWTIWSYLSETYGESEMLALFYNEGNFNDQLEALTSKDLSELEQEWLLYVTSTTW